MEPESLCLHGGYTPGNGEPRVLPIAQSTTFTYESTAAVARLFDLQDEGFFYTRLANPTIDAVERKIAELEGGVGALCTASGQAANLLAILNVARSGDHIISTASIYGGTFNLFAVTLKKMGIEVTFVDQTAPDAEIEKAIRPETRAIFGETLTNPSLDVLDIERMAALAHRHGLPLIVDNTFATPILCRPFDFGADIVVHSTTKYMDGHAVQMGGVIVDSGRFDWTQGRFPEFTEPDASYHGLIYTQTFGKAAYIVKARVQLMRDLGCCQTPQGAFYLNLGLETLPLRMRQHCANAEAVARHLAAHPKVESVTCCALEEAQAELYAALARKLREQVLADVDEKGLAKSQMSILDALLKLRQICCHPRLLKLDLPGFSNNLPSGKFDAFKDMIMEIVEGGHKVLVFSQFVQMLHIIRQWLEFEKMPFCYLDGASKDRFEQVDRFNNSPDIPVFLISLKAGGTGLNLTSADYVIHYDPWWNPAVESQATDRTHRIGQTRQVFSYKLICENTVEEKILKLQEAKRGVADAIIPGQDTWKSLTREDLEMLFEV